MNLLGKYTQLKDKAEARQRQADRAEGAYRQAMKELGCRTIEEAEAMVDDLAMIAAKEKRAFEKALKQYEKELGD